MLRRRAASATLLATAAAVVLTTLAVPAAAADVPVSQSRGFFLRGAVAGTDLATLATLQDATAVNTGGDAVTVANPLAATVLRQLTVPIGQQTVPIGSGLTLGVLNQFAQASPDGSALASSGAVGDDGAVQTGGSRPRTAGNFSLDLQSLAVGWGLPAAQVAALGEVTVTARALAASATQAAFDPAGAAGPQGGSYQIGSLTLDLAGPAALTDLLTGLTDEAQDLLDRVAAALAVLDPLVAVTLPDAADVLASLTTVDGPGFSADLAAGTLSLDVGELIGQDLSALPPNTSLLPLVLAALPDIATAIGAALSASAQAFLTALGAVQVSVLGAPPVDLSALTGLDLAGLTATFTDALDAGATQLGTALGTLGTALSALLALTANGQSSEAGVFTETALSVALLPGGGGAVPTVLALDLANASVGPGAPLPVVPTAAPTPVSEVPVLANTGPAETLGGLALGVWALVAGVALLLASGAAQVKRRRVAAHRR